MTRSPQPAGAAIRLGLRANLGQFSLLVVVNAFVGAMVGLERSILPAIAEQEFQLAARTAVLSFIVVFGVAKAITNYGAGRLADRVGRKHVLVAGWLVAVPVPFLLMWAPTWNWVLVANLLLGISQGLTWSARNNAAWRWGSTSLPATWPWPRARSPPGGWQPGTACALNRSISAWHMWRSGLRYRPSSSARPVITSATNPH